MCIRVFIAAQFKELWSWRQDRESWLLEEWIKVDGYPPWGTVEQTEAAKQMHVEQRGYGSDRHNAE